LCNLYSLTKGQAAILAATRAMHDTTGNLPPLSGIFPDYPAPIVRNGDDGVRELVMARWGMPSPAFALKGKKVDKGVTNIRNTTSPHWRRWLGPSSRCLVPFTSFSEKAHLPDGRIELVWFAANDDRPLSFFAGIWTNWTSVRKLSEVEVTTDLFGFLTTEPNREVGAVHPKTMPVLLVEPDELETWLTELWPEAVDLQRPLPDGALKIVARGNRKMGWTRSLLSRWHRGGYSSMEDEISDGTGAGTLPVAATPANRSRRDSPAAWSSVIRCLVIDAKHL
jgi:putative SOS response-associated peptidase YedK